MKLRPVLITLLSIAFVSLFMVAQTAVVPVRTPTFLRVVSGAVPPPKPYGAIPSERQLRWQEMEVNAFLHFTVNTFTDKEWGYGDEDPSVFDPTDFKPDNIAAALAAAGVKGVILTCKHHDGFCLWPTKTTDHSIAHSAWRDGKGDVVKDVSDAARRHGLDFGVYLSPWDRSAPSYGTPDYIEMYRSQLRELLTGYGPLFEVWYDGANGGDGYYGGAKEKRSIDRRTYYDWAKTWDIVRKLQPGAVIFSDIGPDVRWVGNEKGFAAETSWETYDPVGVDGGPAAPGYVRESENTAGQRNASQWLPAECDVSIRPGWFWHEAENGKVKTAAELFDLYTKCVGRGGNMLLNVPPDRRGQLHEADIAVLKQFGGLLRAAFRTNLALRAKMEPSNVRGESPNFGASKLVDGDRYTYWATDDAVTTPELVVDFGKDQSFNLIRLRENIKLGQRIEAVALDTWVKSKWEQFATATSIGACRIIRLDQPVTTRKLRLRVTKSPVSIALSELGIYNME
jgi:alpha-L-fucosidase